jgi:invasion protein IalB
MPLFGISLDSAAGQSAIPKLVFSPWTKFCPTGGDASGKHVCQTAKLGHTESGQPIVAAILTEPQGNAKKILRVVVPIGMQILRGSRLIVDDGQPVGAPYIGCFSKGCMADYEAKAVPDRFESAGFPKDNG